MAGTTLASYAPMMKERYGGSRVVSQMLKRKRPKRLSLKKKRIGEKPLIGDLQSEN